MESSPYITLLKKSLIDHLKINSYEYHPLDLVNMNWKTAFLYPINRLLKTRNFTICKTKFVTKNERLNGYDWPASALTMIGLKRLDNIEYCVKNILKNKIKGDFIETGVWRGGATILMRALLKEANNTTKKVWLADSFKGLPKPNIKSYPKDIKSNLHTQKILTATKAEVEKNFDHFDLLDNQVVFVEGWFKDSLPQLNIKDISLLRLDGDLYESTYLALTHLYPKLNSGGYIIIDDYNAFFFCKAAVDDYCKENNITEQKIKIDNEAVYWRKL